jgi:hypothetical protein
MNERPPRAILVLGMHRSGTSAVTRVLNLLGAGLGSRLMEPVAGDNEKGYWENLDVLDINERLLAGIDRSWHDVRDMPDGWQESIAASDGHAAIKRFVKEEFAASPLWAVKDPRMCRLAPIWLRALEDCDVQPAILFVVRHPLEVAASLYVRNGWSRARSMLLWTHHVLEAERATRGCPRAVVSYDQILTDWCGTMARASDALGVAWPRAFDGARPEIDAFLDVGQRHHHTSPAQAAAAAASGVVPALVAETFEQYVGLSTKDVGWHHLRELADEFERSSAVYGLCFDDFVRYTSTAAEGGAGYDGNMPMEVISELDRLQHVSDPLSMGSRSSDRANFDTVSQRLGQQAALLEQLSQLVTEQGGRIGLLQEALVVKSEGLRSPVGARSQNSEPNSTEQWSYVSQQLERLTRLVAAQADTISGIQNELAKVRRGHFGSKLQRLFRRADD